MDNEVPLDYKRVFGKNEYPPESITTWKRFFDFAHKDESLSRFWGIGSYTAERWKNTPDFPNLVEILSGIEVYGSLEKLVDRYIHISDQKEMEDALFRPIYQEWERSIFWEQLPINIMVPILGVMFPFERLEISTNISIEKMDDPFQLARNNRSTFTVSTHDIVIGAATHSFILNDWTIKNSILDRRQETLNDIRTSYFALKSNWERSRY